MLRNLFATAATATLLATAAPMFAETMVKEVVVNADMTAVQNAQAGAHWATLTDDLQNAIVSRIAPLIAEDGVKVSVDIDSVELANSFQSAVGIADSKLNGVVHISSETDNSKFETYDLTVTFAQAGPFFLPGTDLNKITTDSKEYYDGMITAFADHIANKLME